MISWTNLKKRLMFTGCRRFHSRHGRHLNIAISANGNPLFWWFSMNVTILAAGKVKEKYLLGGTEEYLKRLAAYAKVKVLEVADEKAPERLSPAEEEQVKAREGDRILQKIKETQHVIALDRQGKQLTSEEMAAYIENCAVQGKSDIVFVIGGSLVLSPAVLQRADFTLSFSKMTFPHQLMRLILLEQVYRAFRIMRGEPYHR